MLNENKTLWYIILVLVPGTYVPSFLNTAQPCLYTHFAAACELPMLNEKKTLWYIILVLVPGTYVPSYLNTAQPCL